METAWRSVSWKYFQYKVLVGWLCKIRYTYLRDHSFSTNAKFPEKLTLLTP